LAWTLDYTPGARKDIRAIRDRVLKRRIEAALLGLREDPRPADAVKLTGYDDVWRVRVGDWRIAYAIREGTLVVLVIAVSARGEIYELVRRRGR
jgi:mRNA interferase RelE/StbE